jgi:hypothetical protein
MSEERQPYRRDEKDHEKREKEEEKHEKSWEEKWIRDPLSSAVWAIIIIWAGLVLLAINLEMLARFEGVEGWELFFLGAGLILLLAILVRLLVPAYRQPVLGTAILATVFMAIGLGAILGTAVIWALLLMAAGVYILYRGLFQRRE